MRKYMLFGLSCVFGVGISPPAAAYSYSVELAFCPQTDKVIAHCWVKLESADSWNFVGGVTDECFIENWQGTIIADAKFFDGDLTQPRGEVITTRVDIFPNASPLRNFKEYCARFEDGEIWRFPWSSITNYVIKAFVVDHEEFPPPPADCGSHETGQ